MTAATCRARTTARAKPPGQKTKTGFRGGNIKMPTKELVYVWASLMDKAVKVGPFELRVWLAARETFEERKFASRGCKPVFKLSELDTLIGGGGERAIRKSLGRLRRAGLMSWSTKGPRFANSPESLAASTLPLIEKIEKLMPKNREFFPIPRKVLKLLAGGVKRSVLATVFAHLLRCPHLKRGVWDPVGTCKASWVEETFGLSIAAVREARSHLIHQLGWLSPKHEDQPQWHKNKYGGRFEVNLEWAAETPTKLAERVDGATFSTAESGPPNPRIGAQSGPPESEQPSPSEISTSALGGHPPEPRSDFFKPAEERTKAKPDSAPTLSNIVPADLVNVARVMELFEQALVNPRWRERGWTPKDDSHLERLNWAAAARRAHVRGSAKPCGVFVHLVSQRKWAHVSNEDEDAVRAAFSRWATPVLPVGVEETRTGMPELRSELSTDGAVIRRIENALRERAPLASRTDVDDYLKRQAGWGSERVEAARSSYQAWRRCNP